MTAIARQADGKVLIGGDFSTVGGIARPRLARLLDDAPPPTTVQFDQSSYSVAENGGSATITVTRTGSTAAQRPSTMRPRTVPRPPDRTTRPRRAR